MSIQHDKWRGAAEAFCLVARSVNAILSKRIGVQNPLSMYGRRGYGDHYTDHLTRIDAAIEMMQDARRLLIEAEALRAAIVTTNAGNKRL